MGDHNICLKKGWMDDLQFYVLSTVFHSYKDDGQMIMKDCMKGCMQWNPI